MVDRLKDLRKRLVAMPLHSVTRPDIITPDDKSSLSILCAVKYKPRHCRTCLLTGKLIPMFDCVGPATVREIPIVCRKDETEKQNRPNG